MKRMVNHLGATTAPRLDSRLGAQPVLEGVRLRAELDDLLAQVRVEQRFANREAEPIEAVYTFPVPVGAVLLGFSARLGDRELTARVLPAPEAVNSYEEAVAVGDGAILLQEASPGLHTVNLGNVLPGQEVLLSYHYAQLQHWQEDSLRFVLPTVVAPRYGNPLAAGLQPHQVPVEDLLVERGAALDVLVRGALAQAEIRCPTHAIQLESVEDGQRVRFAGSEEAAMDRDIVLLLRQPAGQPDSAQVESGEDGTRTALLSLRLRPSADRPGGGTPRCFKILVDASGSMNGDSIAQARAALQLILDALRPQDRFTIMAFGSSHQLLTPVAARADARTLQKARRAIAKLDADLGGTELRRALLALLDQPAPDGMEQDLLLITDGEVFDAGLVEEARHRGLRIFTVGVGCAPGESLLAGLAEATGGAAEFVTPGEEMAGRILRHFHRMRLPRARSLQVGWPGQVKEERRDREGGLFEGETLHLFARLEGSPGDGEVQLTCEWEDGTRQVSRLPLRPVVHTDGSLPGVGLLARLLAAADLRRFTHLRPDEAERRRLTDRAVRCGLLSPWTACLLVDERAEAQRTDGQPALRQVPQMLAAGWHGMGTVHAYECRTDTMYCRRSFDLSAGIKPGFASPMPSQTMLWKLPSAPFSSPPGQLPEDLQQLESLERLGLAPVEIDELRARLDLGQDEGELCLRVWHGLLVAGVATGLSRDTQRALRRAASALPSNPDLAALAAEIVAKLQALAGGPLDATLD